MERITLRVPKRDIQGLENLVEKGEYPNRSEAARAAIRGLLEEYNLRPRVVADGSGESERDPDEMTADDWETFLDENRDKVLMCLDNDFSIHEFEWDEHSDELSFLAYGSQGYDYAGSRAALEVAVTGPVKVVDRDEVRRERERLSDGHYETPEEWADDRPQVLADGGQVGNERDQADCEEEEGPTGVVAYTADGDPVRITIMDENDEHLNLTAIPEEGVYGYENEENRVTLFMEEIND